MKLNEEYKIECTDSLNITLMKRTKDKDGVLTDNYRPVGYYTKFKEALKAFAQKEILGTGLDEYSTICAKIDELNAKIDRLGDK